MRVLLDEQVPKDLVPELVGHEVRTVGQLAWKGLENGELVARAAASFDVVITMDKRMPTELDVTRYRIGVVLIRASSNRIEALRPLGPAILQAIEDVRHGQCGALVPNRVSELSRALRRARPGPAVRPRLFIECPRSSKPRR